MRIACSLLLLISLCIQGPAFGLPERPSADDVALTILYDNTSAIDSVMADHGFSCLVESRGHYLLFDAGRMADKFLANARRLGVDLSKIEDVFISHVHGDHMGGLADILAGLRKPTLYLPFSYPRLINEPSSDRADRDWLALLERFRPFVSGTVRKKEPIAVGRIGRSTGTIDDVTYEQALIIPTAKGLIVITGCAHPGILEIVVRARELMKQDVFLVMGGFHLAAADPARVQAIARELRGMTKRIGPCHCTGERAVGIFREVFQEDFIDVRAGTKLRVGGLANKADEPPAIPSDPLGASVRFR